MSFKSLLRAVLPLKVRKFIYQKYADKILEQAILLANQKFQEDGHRYYVLPCKNGSLKVTNADTETRDKSRINDKRLLKKSIRKPYQLRKESFYFTPSKVCKKKYNPDGMLDWEIEGNRENYYNWFFSRY